MAAAVFGSGARQHSRISSGGHNLNTNSNVPTNLVQHNYGIPSLVSSTTHQMLPPPENYQNITSPSSSTNRILIPPPLYDQPQSLSLQDTPPTPPPQQFHFSTICRQTSTKRKSAVELLAESKPFYVKSENVLDRSQHLHLRSLSGGFPASTLSTLNQNSQLNQCVYVEQPQSKCSPMLSSPPHRLQQNGVHNRNANRRSASNSSDLLQTKLRKLLNTDAKDSDYQYNKKGCSDYKFNNINDCDNIDTQNSKISVSNLSLTLLSPPPNTSDVVFPLNNSIITEDFRTISPPAEYACNNSNEDCLKSKYQRSNSNSFESQQSDNQNYSSSCHKSLPDLHSQMGVQNRHSPHSEVLSCCSRGNRSIKSGGSSINRDSGGSSGHYTHRSDPCCKQQHLSCHQNARIQDQNLIEYNRRDSGSSTQHSGNSYFVSGQTDCPVCLLNTVTPEVPEAFQDSFPSVSKTKRYSATKHERNAFPVARKCRCSNNTKQYEDQCCDISNSGNGKPILRSKSDISDRYWRHYQPPPQSPLLSPPYIEKIKKSESLSQLEFFFDRLGLDDDKFNEIYYTNKKKNSIGSDSSDTVFFSDISTIDSSKFVAESHTESETPTYRPTEPTSIVERNARIIKWLCNCRRVQAIFQN